MKSLRRKKLKVWRVEHDMTQQDLADKLGVTVSYINQIELGKQKPSYGLMMNFREKFNEEDVLGLFESEKEEREKE